MRRLLPLFVAFSLLAGCSTGDAVSYRADPNSNDLVLSLARERNFLWEDWTPKLTITHLPACQRRYALKPVSGDLVFKIEVYLESPGVYILRQGKRWYVADSGKCQFQQFPEAPPEPGTLLGAYTDKDGPLVFKPAESGGK